MIRQTPLLLLAWVSLTPAAAAPRTDAHGDPLPPGAVARLGTLRLRHSGGVRALAFAADGKTLASAGDDRTIRLWDVATGKEVCQVGRQIEVSLLRFLPGGQGLLAGSRAPEEGVQVWNVGGAKQRRMLSGADELTFLAVSEDGKLLAWAGGQRWTQDAYSPKALHLVDGVTGKEVRRLAVADAVRSLALSADGKRLAVGDSAHQVRLWDAATGALLQRLKPPSSMTVWNLSFSPDGKVLAAYGTGRPVFWDTRTGKMVRQLGNASTNAQHLGFSPNGKILASAQEAEAHLWDVATGKLLGRLVGHGFEVRCLAFSPDGKTLATGSEDRTIRFWDVITRKAKGPLAERQGGEVFAEFLADGKTIALRHHFTSRRMFDLGKESYSFTTWRLKEGSEVIPVGRIARRPGEACLSGDGKLIAVNPANLGEGAVHLLDTATGKELRQVGGSGEGSFAGHGAFSSDSKILAVAHTDWEPGSAETPRWKVRLRLWNVASGKCLRVIERDPGEILEAPGFSPDGRLLASVRRAGLDFVSSVSLWRADTGERIRLLGREQVRGSCFAFSPAGNFLAVGGKADCPRPGWRVGPEGLRIDLLDVTTGAAVLSLEGHRGKTCCCFSPDGKLLASGGEEGVVRLSEVHTGKEVGRLRGHESSILSVSFSGDGRFLVSGSDDTTALLWNVAAAVGPPVPPVPLDDKTVAALWADLGSDDVRCAYRALFALADAPRQSISFLKERLRPVERVSAGRVAALLVDLDNPVFATRTRAVKELTWLERSVTPALRRALIASPSLEVRRRLEELLATAEKPGRAAARMQVLRAIQALERAGTPAARQLLETVSQGAAAAQLTQEAEAALRRLSRHPVPR